MSLHPGVRIGPYEIEGSLGAGGMGEVYKARDGRLGRSVAIKVLPATTRADAEAERRMLREARMVATIDHPNVCAIYEIGADHERPYIVMQYIQGDTLLERMRREPLDVKETVAIARQITAALAEAHGRGIVHRDIKPSNIMISSTGIVKVLDFGLAKSFGQEASVAETMETRAGIVAGTTAYMSPEQLRAEPLDGRSDIFSLGVVLYEIAAGIRPFDRPTIAGTITAILSEDPPPIGSPLQPVIARALAKAPSRRFPSAAALDEALTAIGEGRTRKRRDRRAPISSAETQTATIGRPSLTRGGGDIETPTGDVTKPLSASGRGRAKEGDSHRSSADSTAEKLYLRGRFQWNKRHPDAIRQAIACFQEALERDPMYANAYAGLADAYLMLGFVQALPPIEVVPKAKASARRAIELDPTLAEPHAAIGYMAGLFDWQWEAAKRELSEAMELNPKYPWAPHWYGMLASARSLEEAVEYLTKARDLDPISPIINTAIGIPLHLHRRFRQAVRVYSQVLESEAAFAPAHYYIGMSYEQLGEYDAAVTNLNRAIDITGRLSLFLGTLGHCYAVSGRHDLAKQLLQELDERSKDRYVCPYNVMLIHLGLGDNDAALGWLDRALQERTALLWMLPAEPRFDSVRGDPRFQQLVAGHGLRTEL